MTDEELAQALLSAHKTLRLAALQSAEDGELRAAGDGLRGRGWLRVGRSTTTTTR